LQWTGDTVNNAIPSKTQIGFFKIQLKKEGPEDSERRSPSARPAQHSGAAAVAPYANSGPLMTGFTKVDQNRIKQHHHNSCKNADVIEQLEKKRADLVHEASHDQKAFAKTKKRTSI